MENMFYSNIVSKYPSCGGDSGRVRYEQYLLFMPYAKVEKYDNLGWNWCRLDDVDVVGRHRPASYSDFSYDASVWNV